MQAKEDIIARLCPLLCLGHTPKRGEVRRGLDAASNVPEGHINSNLTKGDIFPKLVWRSSFGPFWGRSLALVKKERS